MNAHVSPITSSDIENPIRLLSTRELLAAMVGFHDELNRRGSLADAPDHITSGLDFAEQIAREAKQWLEDEGPACMSREDWTGESSLRRTA